MDGRSFIIPVVLLAGVALSGCQRGVEEGHLGPGAAGICTPFKTADSAATPAAGTLSADGSVTVGECLHRWGYALAPAHENADVVAAAAATACSTDISNWNQQSLNQSAQQPTDATSLTTGQPTNLLADHAQFAQSQALFYVVQARAGGCSPPPSNLLVRTAG
jgi:hypothetical protein